MVVDGAQVQEVLLGEDGVAQGAAEGSLCVDMSTIAPGDSRRIAAELARARDRLRRRAGHRLEPEGRGRDADDHGRRRRRRLRARPPAVRGDGRADRARRRGGRPGRDGQAHQQRRRGGQRPHAGPGARRRARHRHRPRRAGAGHGRRQRRLGDARPEGRPDARARLLDALQARAHAQGRPPVPRGGAGRGRSLPRRGGGARGSLGRHGPRPGRRGLRRARGDGRGLSPACAFRRAHTTVHRSLHAVCSFGAQRCAIASFASHLREESVSRGADVIPRRHSLASDGPV